MLLETFMRNWVLHYIQPVFLYLPDTISKKNKSKKIVIKPISYVHDAYQQQGYNPENSFQYFYADYKNPIDTGTLSFEPTKFQLGSSEKPDPIPQQPCLYRIYCWNEERKKYTPITTEGIFDEECSDKSLYKNTNTFNLKVNQKYFYREEQASEGDLLHKELEEFGLSKENDIILYEEEFDEKIHNRLEACVELNEKTGEYENILKIKHYPKMVKVYVTFDKGEERSLVTFSSEEYDFWAAGWLGARYIKERWTSSLADNCPYGDSTARIASARRYKVYPKELRITYMEKEVSGIRPFPKYIHSDSPEVQAVYKKLCWGRDIQSSGMYGGGQDGAAQGDNVTIPDSCAPEWYLGETLLHTGEEISWCDTGSPNWERYSTPETRQYGHYFYVPSNGSGSASIASGTKISDTFWIKSFPSAFVSLTATKINKDHTRPDGSIIKGFSFVDPFKRDATLNMNTQGEFLADIVENNGFKKPLIQLKIQTPKVTLLKDTREYNSNGDETKKTLETAEIRQDGIGYGWAGIEDVVGMSCWCMAQLTKYDPNGSISDPYYQWNCQPGQPLYIAWGQYENSDTKDFTKDTVTVSQSYASDDPLMPFDSPIKRKGKQADNNVAYAIYDKERLHFINENCDIGCSCVVSYVKTTRQKYFNFIREKDSSLNGEWIIRKETE